MFRRTILVPASALLGSMIILLSSASAFAAASASVGSGDGMRVSPVRTDLTIKPGSSQTIDVYVQNLTSQTADLEGIVDDFTANSNESGAPAILLNGQDAPTHSLRRYVESIGSFELAPNATKDVKVTISIPNGLAGGGYYGVVRFAPTSVGSSGKNLNLSASVGSLVLVTVPGKIVEQMNIASFDVRHITSKANPLADGPSTFFTSPKSLDAMVRFQNTGNLQEAPFGNIILKKGKKVIDTYQINNATPRGDVLPGTIRYFIAPLNNLGSFGRYTLEGNFGYGTTGQLLTAQTSFYVVPVTLLIIAGLVVLLILFIIFVLPRLIRAYNRSVVRRASRTRR